MAGGNARFITFVVRLCDKVSPAEIRYGIFHETIKHQRVYSRFQGNADTSLERAYDFALLRSAEVTLHNGFWFFSVLDVTNTSSTKRYTRVFRTSTDVRII